MVGMSIWVAPLVRRRHLRALTVELGELEDPFRDGRFGACEYVVGIQSFLHFPFSDAPHFDGFVCGNWGKGG